MEKGGPKATSRKRQPDLAGQQRSGSAVAEQGRERFECSVAFRFALVPELHEGDELSSRALALPISWGGAPEPFPKEVGGLSMLTEPEERLRERRDAPPQDRRI